MRYPLFYRSIVAVAAIAMPAIPQQRGLDGPSLGLVYDAVDQAIRPLAGLPGAAQAGDPLASGYSSAAIAPTPGFAIVFDGEYKVWTAEGSQVLPGHFPSAAQVSFSSAGKSAVIYANGGSSVFVITGLPEQPKTVERAVPGQVSAIAVNDAGTALASIVVPGGEKLYLIDSGNPPVPILELDNAGAVVFARDNQTAFVADRRSNRLWRIAGVTSSPAAQLLVDDLSTPVAIAVSPDGTQVFAANAGSSTISVIDVAGSAPEQKLSCDCTPTALRQFADGHTFQVTEAGAGPIWILDTTGLAPRIAFIPAISRTRPQLRNRPMSQSQGER